MTVSTPVPPPPDAPAHLAPGARRALGLSEVLAALSHALDITEGQPVGHTVRACVIGMRLANEAGCSEGECSALYYGLLLKDIGCSANATETAALFGADDREAKRSLKTVDWTRFLPATRYGVRMAGQGGSLPAKARRLLRIALGGQRAARQLVRIRCERGAEIVRTLGLPEATADIVRCLDEHWDGGGHPAGRRGEEIPPGSRIALLAQTIDAFRQEHDAATALEAVAARAGSWFDPALIRIVRTWRADDPWWDTLSGERADALALEARPPGMTIMVDDDRLDRVAEAFADVIDAKSPYTFHHSTGVADYARRLGAALDFGADAERGLYRAGLLHDIGKLAISSTILNKAGGLTPAEREIVQAHPVFTWTVLSRVSAFQDLARTAALHHERLDGTGYPWGYAADRLTPADRILAVADMYEALTARRPYREPLPPARALAILREEAENGGLDGDIVGTLAALLENAG